MAYLGNTPTTQNFISGTDYFNGNASTVAFTLSRTVASVNDIEVVVNNVVQQPNTAYTISGTTITFTGAPSAGTGNVYVRYLSTTTQAITPSQGTVQYSSLNADNQSKLGISFKNRIINGAMVIDQRNAGASITANDGSYAVDRFSMYAFTSGKGTIQQNQNSVTPPAGFKNYLGFTSSGAYSVPSGEAYMLQQRIEGYNIADLAWGTADAKPVTVSFWVRSSLTGTFGFCLNSGTNRAYPATYTISSANTWEYKTITISGDTTGTWTSTNGLGVNVFFGLGVGSNYAGTAGSWAASNYLGATGCVSVVGTSGATFYITGVQLEVGTQATTFDYRSYGTELALCQRYYQTSTIGTPINVDGGYCGSPYSNGTEAYGVGSLRTSMRAQPTITLYDNVGSSGAVTQAGQANGIAATASRISIAGFTSINKSSGSWASTSSTNPIIAGFIASSEL